MYSEFLLSLKAIFLLCLIFINSTTQRISAKPFWFTWIYFKLKYKLKGNILIERFPLKLEFLNISFRNFFFFFFIKLISSIYKCLVYLNFYYVFFGKSAFICSGMVGKWAACDGPIASVTESSPAPWLCPGGDEPARRKNASRKQLMASETPGQREAAGVPGTAASPSIVGSAPSAWHTEPH